MDVTYQRCCGLDIHKKIVVACLIIPGDDGQPRKEMLSFGTMTEDLLKLSDWLNQHQVTHVAMESTGVYWKPIYNLLEGNFELFLANARHIKSVPGRKTDVKDSEWIADLLRHGLIRGSFVPERPQRELRELTQYRTSLVQERTAEVNRLHKTLEGANIKLASVATDIMGVSGRQILKALISGTSDAASMAQLAKGQLRKKLSELKRALEGSSGAHQRFLISRQLAHIDFLDEAIAHVSAEIQERLRPFEETVARLDTIPGIGQRTAQALLAEIGNNVDRFPTAGHLASWAGMCPGNNESAGKRKSGKTRKGSPWLRALLVEAAQAASRTKHSYLAARYHRLVARRGRKRAIVAVAHSILIIVYHMLKRNSSYQELGLGYFDELNREHLERRLVHRLEGLGYEVSLQSVAA